MSALPGATALPAWQQTIWDRCYHPTGTCIAFQTQDIEQAIPQRFEAQVRAYPTRIAVQDQDTACTYETLNKAANRIAYAILERQQAKQAPVALLFEQGTAVFAAIFGVLKAGQAYVALDTDFPYARNTFLLQDSQATLLLTNSQNFAMAQSLARQETHLINVDTLPPHYAEENPQVPLAPDSLAYIMYTSGATGEPKGVMQTHRNVLHKVMSFTNSIHICPDDRLVLLYSHSASGATRDMFSALLNGAALYPCNIKQRGLPALISWIADAEITIYNSVGTLFRHLLSTVTTPEALSSLRVVTLGSETLYKQDVELYKKYLPQQCVFVARLGSIEMSPIREYFVDKDTDITTHTVPAGYPVWGVDILLLDEAGHDVAVNEVGEIVVRSSYLPLGYWRRPELTRAVFPQGPVDGQQRLYRTGDLGLLQPDGCLVHLGRKDFQVKIRGYRIEVAEIEKALLDLGSVQEAVVVAQAGPLGDQCLVAYIVMAEKTGLAISAIRQRLTEALPPHMVPAAFVVLDALPLTPVGKVDRQALPAPDARRPDMGTAFVAPRTQIETELARIWAEMLQVDRVGIYDDFLELGGHSLLANRIIAKVVDTFRVSLPLQALFDAPTIAEMAVVIAQNLAMTADETQIEHMLAELEALTDTEAQALLDRQR